MKGCDVPNVKRWVITALLALLSQAMVSAQPDPETEMQFHVRGRTAKDVLRSHLGVTGGTGPFCPVLRDDPTQPLFLPEGDFSIEFYLHDMHIVNELAFVNEGARGAIKCLVSTDHETWVEAVTAHLLPASRASRVQFAGSEARFVRFDFSVSTSGSLYCVGLFGLTVAADYTLTEVFDELERPDNESEAEISQISTNREIDEISLTISPSDARVPWVSSLEDPVPAAVEALELIDENSFTVCEFAPDDPNPSVIMDLHGTPTVERVAVLYAKQPGILHLRLLETIDRQGHGDEHGGGEESSEDERFVFKDVNGIGRFSFDRLATRSRYVELIWEPEIQADPGQPQPAFSINEVAVFSLGGREYVEQAPLRPSFSAKADNTVVQTLVASEPLTPATQTPVASQELVDPEKPLQKASGEVPDLELDPVSF